MKFLKRIMQLFSIDGSSRDQHELAIYKKSADDTSNLFRQQLNENRVLRETKASMEFELDFLYSILFKRTNCAYKMQVIITERAKELVIVTNSIASKISELIIYSPSKRIQVAQLFMQQVNDTLRIEDVNINHNYFIQGFGNILMGELIAESKRKNLIAIEGIIRNEKGIQMHEIVGFYQNIGFKVIETDDRKAASILYKVV